ncbi:MAG TPA: hypothetical protein VL402_04610 [Xanthobacteraceae bacterium]|jgi:hypothetical protein|nr:hypothetical protein [Xanthobacteraceae bacterium]
MRDALLLQPVRPCGHLFSVSRHGKVWGKAGRWTLAVCAVAALVLILITHPLRAQQANNAAHTPSQIKLTEAQVTGFIGTQKDLAAIAGKLDAAGDDPDDKLRSELDGIVKKRGFAGFDEFDDVNASIMAVLAGLDPATGQYSDPRTQMEKDIATVKSDKTISENDRKQMLAEMSEALKELQPVQFPDNVALVRKHVKDLEDALK